MAWTWLKSLRPPNPPVCRITDFDKYRYAQKKKTHDSKRHSTASAIKEVKMGARTDKHDVEFKIKHIRRFVTEGQRVKLSISFRGREITHPELGRTLLDSNRRAGADIAQAGRADPDGRAQHVGAADAALNAKNVMHK